MSVASSSPPLNSKALQANLQETAGEVHIDARFTPLQEIVSRQQGLSSKIHSLLHEVSHPYHNWKLIIPELRSYVLKNINGGVNIDNQNRLHPFYMVYISNDGNVICDHLAPQWCLAIGDNS